MKAFTSNQMKHHDLDHTFLPNRRYAKNSPTNHYFIFAILLILFLLESEGK